jgi:manganese/iron transport system permease protein
MQQLATFAVAAVEGLAAIWLADAFNVGPGPAMAVFGACAYGLAAVLSKGVRPFYVRGTA